MNISHAIKYGLVALGLVASMAIQAATETELRAIAMDTAASKAQRVEAIKTLYKSQLVNGKLPERKICVWDVVGRSGPVYAATIDQQAQLMDLGIQIRVEAYTNEGVLSDDLRAGHCDAALFTGLRARLFNKFTGTLDAVGAIPSSEHMNLLMQVLVNPRNAKRMEEGQYVVLGMAPMGAAYIFVNDKAISSLARAAGKRVAVMDYDPVQSEMVLGLGATPVPVSIVNAGSIFNNRGVDVLPSPLVAYHMMELHKGLGTKGGIVNYPFTQLTLQLVGRKDKFPTEVAQLIREDFYQRMATIEKIVEQNTGEIPSHYWVEIPAGEKLEYQRLMQEARVHLRDRNYYDGEMLGLQRRVRCRIEPTHSECVNTVE